MDEAESWTIDAAIEIVSVDIATLAARGFLCRRGSMNRRPSPLGVHGVVLDGDLLSYRYLLEKDPVVLVGGRR